MRITPAWAGKRDTLKAQAIADGDHPRVGGEKSAFNSSDLVILGSPPRGRGKVLRPLTSCSV